MDVNASDSLSWPEFASYFGQNHLALSSMNVGGGGAKPGVMTRANMVRHPSCLPSASELVSKFVQCEMRGGGNIRYNNERWYVRMAWGWRAHVLIPRAPVELSKGRSQSGRLRFKRLNTGPRDNPNEPYASPPGGIPSAFDRGSPLKSSIETSSRVHNANGARGSKRPLWH